ATASGSPSWGSRTRRTGTSSSRTNSGDRAAARVMLAGLNEGVRPRSRRRVSRVRRLHVLEAAAGRRVGRARVRRRGRAGQGDEGEEEEAAPWRDPAGAAVRARAGRGGPVAPATAAAHDGARAR